MVPATETLEIDIRPRHRKCRVCREPIHSGEIAYKTALHTPQGSRTGHLRYWTCTRCQAALDDVLDRASKRVGAAL